MSRNFQLRLNDILDAANAIGDYIGERNIDQFKQDRQLIDSVLYNLLVIGEAANNIPENLQNQYPDVDWRNIVGLRNVVSHEYFRVNLDRIWDITQNALPAFREQILTLLASDLPEGDD